jgi:hypothetical protein
MRLVAAELLKMRRRAMTYVLLIIQIVVMALVFLVLGTLVAPFLADLGSVVGPTEDASRVIYAIVGEFVFGMGSLLAVIYAGAIVGGDYTWGVVRNAIARGESREAYLLAKAVALAIVIAIGATLAFVIGVAMILLVASLSRLDLGNLLTVDSLLDLGAALGLGTLVLLERAAIGIAVALMLRSQLAGIVVAVVLYIVEPLVAGIAAAISAPATIFLPEPTAPAVHWTAFLPFTIGSSVLNEGSAALGSLVGGLVANVPLAQSVPVVLLYMAGAIGLAMFVMRRQEIT